MWFLPSRGRPANMARLLEAWRKTEASTPLILIVDADDPTLPEYKQLPLPENWTLRVAPERKPLGELVNDAYRTCPDEPWYGFIDDDRVPGTMHWDTELVKTAGTDGMAYSDDGIKGELLSTNPVVAGDLVRKMGWFVPPGLDRLYIDTVWMAYARRNKVARYRGDVKTTHLHFSIDPTAFDATYMKPSARKDREVFDQWLWSIDPTIHFATVKWGFKYGPDYVNILYDMIKRNLPAPLDFKPRFICFTDDPSGLDPDIETQPLPKDLKGWWNKLYLFKEGVFDEGSRVVFLDLDTAIVGDIRDIVGYRGEFAILRDFYRPRGLGSGAMMWRGGFGTAIWDQFIKAGKPDIAGGDQAWIERFRGTPDILQDLFLDAFISFKESAMLSLPSRAKIVCFHGEPKPHQVKNGWLEQVWKKSGIVANAGMISGADPIANVKHALNLPFPCVEGQIAIDANRHVCIVGGGASARDAIAELKQRKNVGQEIWALDGAWQWLSAADVTPDAHVLLSPDRERAELVPTEKDVTLLYASQCHPDVFARAAKTSRRITVWHPMIDGIRTVVGSRSAAFIGGGSTLGMRAITLAYILGYRNIHLFGFDSSYRGEENAESISNDNDQRIKVEIDKLIFASSPQLAQQINEFRTLMQKLAPQGVVVTMHGDGLLPYVAAKMQRLSQGK
jgi:uncharacterized Rossmann fold enzyme